MNRSEHEARRSLSDTRHEQARTLKAGEHLAHRDISAAARVEGVAVSTDRSTSCAGGLDHPAIVKEACSASRPT